MTVATAAAINNLYKGEGRYFHSGVSGESQLKVCNGLQKDIVGEVTPPQVYQHRWTLQQLCPFILGGPPYNLVIEGRGRYGGGSRLYYGRRLRYGHAGSLSNLHPIPRHIGEKARKFSR